MTAYEMRISDLISDVCSSDLRRRADAADVEARVAQACRDVHRAVVVADDHGQDLRPAGGDAERHAAFGGVADEGVEARLAFGPVRGDLDRLLDEPGPERRGRGREAVGEAAVGEEIAGTREEGKGAV